MTTEPDFAAADRLAAFERFVAPEPNTGCWLWMGAATFTANGPRGQFAIKRKSRQAARVAWELYRSPIPAGLDVCHTCDVTLCVNPAHLFLGTRKENMQDAVRKRRIAFGARNGQTKLSESDVREIRKRTMNMSDTARRFGVSRKNIERIWIKETWQHVE